MAAGSMNSALTSGLRKAQQLPDAVRPFTSAQAATGTEAATAALAKSPSMSSAGSSGTRQEQTSGITRWICSARRPRRPEEASRA